MAFDKKPYRRQGNDRSNRSSRITNHSSKRSPLSKLMTEEAKATSNIQDLSYDFACRITRLFQYLTEDSNYKEFIMSKQVVRSGTSIGANVREAQHGRSDADFYAKMSIALKEADETQYWQSLLHDNGYISDFQFASLDQDIQRILRLLKSITKSTKEKIDREKK